MSPIPLSRVTVVGSHGHVETVSTGIVNVSTLCAPSGVVAISVKVGLLVPVKPGSASAVIRWLN